MTIITVSVQNEQDAEMLKGLIETAKFKEEVEVYEESDEYTAEDVAEWDKRLAAYDADPSRGKTIAEAKQILKKKNGL